MTTTRSFSRERAIPEATGRLSRAVQALLTPQFDVWTVVAMLTLVVLGVVMVAASSPPVAEDLTNDPQYFFKRQVLFCGIGAVAMWVGTCIPASVWRGRAGVVMLGTLALLVLVLIPGIGQVVGGARRWIGIGSFNLQAGECAKLAVVMFMAAALSKRTAEQTSRAKLSALLLMPSVAAALLLLEPDFGTAMLIMTVTLTLLFVAGARMGALFGALALAMPLVLLLVSSSAYRMRRVMAFLDPWSHRHDIGYQITESLMTIGSGGFFGLGLGQSRQKLFFLPASYTDFIFAMVGEELGFLGVSVVIGLFVIIAVRAFRAAMQMPDTFEMFVCVGLGAIVSLQAVFNMSVVLGLVPTKGITLPFVSYGGSSLIVSMFAGGVLARAIAACQSGRSDERGTP